MESFNKHIFRLALLIVLLIFTLRLFYLQIWNKKFQLASHNNSLYKETLYPPRGNIYDRYGTLLVHNEPLYDIYIYPRYKDKMDIKKLSYITDIAEDKIKGILKKTTAKAQLLASNILHEEFLEIQDTLSTLPGIQVKVKMARNYPHPTLANTIGYLGEVNKSFLDKNKDKYVLADRSAGNLRRTTAGR